MWANCAGITQAWIYRSEEETGAHCNGGGENLGISRVASAFGTACVAYVWRVRSTAATYWGNSCRIYDSAKTTDTPFFNPTRIVHSSKSISIAVRSGGRSPSLWPWAHPLSLAERTCGKMTYVAMRTMHPLDLRQVAGWYSVAQEQPLP